MKKIILIFFLINFNNIALGFTKENIINNLNSINSFRFLFEQNINGNIERGDSIIKYPKKIKCKYKKSNGKILVSNGKSLVIKTKNGTYYRYGITQTPLNYILDKDFLINEIKSLKGRIINEKFINFTIFKNENEINIFFDKKDSNLIGWQILDIYQNLNITYIDIFEINKKINENEFKLPKPD